MEQTNSLALNMLQSIVSQATGIPKTGKTDSTDDFQKLLEEKAQAKDPLVEQPKTQTTAAAKKPEKAPEQKQENALERAKKLAEQGAWFTQPDDMVWVEIDFETGETIAVHQPGEYMLAHLGGETEVIPLTGLEPWERLQMQELLANSGQVADVSDPEADALLEATAPGADNSPAALLEKMAAEQFGQEVQQAVEEANPQQTEDDQQVELLDAEQAPQRIFHDVEAAPVKVGETELPQQAEEPDVAGQVNAQLIQAMQRGDSVVRVQLNPEHLGSVTVEISQSADGILRIALSAHSSETRSLLERHAADLQGLVSSRTQQEVQVDVQRQAESQQGQNQQHQQDYDGHNGQPQDGQEHRRQHRHTSSSQDFMQQLRLGLIPADGES